MKKRIQSVDIFRGMTILLMILVNTPGTWSAQFAPLRHAEWHGYTPTDLVFPFFLFIVGTSIVFAYKNREVDVGTYKKIALRSLKLILLGLFLVGFTFEFPFIKDVETLRFTGVLQRIGLVFFFTSILFLNFSWKSLIAISAVLLTGYWLLLGYVPVNGMAPTYENEPHNLANYIDKMVLGSHMFYEDYDLTGFFSTIPSNVSALMGVFTGMILVSDRKNKVASMVGIGLGTLSLGYLWSLVFPINKTLWSSSYVLATTGWANLMLAMIYYLTDVRDIKFGSIFKYVGANAITLYFLSIFGAKLFVAIKVDDGQSLHGYIFRNVYVHEPISLEMSSMLYALGVVVFYCILAYIMYRQKIFIKV